MRVELTSMIGRLGMAVECKSATVEGVEGVEGVEKDDQALRDSLRVSLSELGKARSAAAQKNQDIDDSSLPDLIKDLLKRIRALKEQIEVKKEELNAVMSDQSLDPEAKRLKIETLQGELASLQGALSSANATLLKVLSKLGLTDQQMQEVSSLLMK
ncbi:hypothetical protein OU997_17970 [Pseudomonas sp. SL4(2022)]|uniref:hypothetical protein n=1 Tax=Pseudomonas sp. SL4(2022) TaxID=2994661 RepID=UPI00226D6298|nr:hypothetical protein [Pseudomonas sp. SL4(2022)]WAC44103.1 hypothetical protein OU997_17970 [Pseudomonas sp. SL4(2022)]